MIGLMTTYCILQFVPFLGILTELVRLFVQPAALGSAANVAEALWNAE